MKTRSFVWLAGLVLAGAAWSQDLPPAEVRVTEARLHRVRGSVRLPGTVEAATRSRVAAQIAGLVDRIHAREGDRVARDAPLVQLRTTDLRLQRRVAVGQLEEAEARLEQAERKLTRSRELFDSGILSQDELDDARSEDTAWRARRESLRATIERIDVALHNATIRAPFAGIVVEEMVDLGEWVELGAEVAELTSTERLEVRIQAPERYFRQLRPGIEAVVTFESVPGREFGGRVIAVIPAADDQARSFPVKLRLDDPNAPAAAWMLAVASLPLGSSYEATIVPKDAVVRQGPTRIVYRANGEDVAESVNVTVGSGVGVWQVVEGDLRPGDRIVTRGNERIFPGQPLIPKVLEYPLP